MPPLTPADTAPGSAISRGFTVTSQHLQLEVDLRNRILRGSTQIKITPLSKDFRHIRLNCRQCKLGLITVNDVHANYKYRDPFERMIPQSSYGAHQAHLFRQRFEPQLKDPPDEELDISIPRSVKIQESDENKTSKPKDNFGKATSGSGNVTAIPDTPAPQTAVEQTITYATITVSIDFVLEQPRDGIHFVGLSEEDGRFPHAFTRHSPFAGTACSIFPCVDDLQSRCKWTTTIKCPRTLGDALSSKVGDTSEQASGEQATDSSDKVEETDGLGMTDEERSLELIVVGSGDVTDDNVDPADSSKKLTSFTTKEISISANQIGFAIGPFENVDLSNLREIAEDDKLGNEAVSIHAFVLPGRGPEARNTCLPLAKAVDFYTKVVASFPFSNYSMCFLDDLQADTTVTAGLSFCSNRLLFPEDIIDPLYDVTRKLVHALACQYAGISVTAKDLSDTWCIVGMAYFITDVYLKTLMGTNEYRYRQKLAADRIVEQDVDRPSLHSLGAILHLDPSEGEFLALKASSVLFILDRRMTKSSGSAGMTRIVSRTMTNSKADDPELTLLSTGQFQRTCEKLGHVKLDGFFQQWIYGAGCPCFEITQRYNKKKSVVEMTINQIQGDLSRQRTRDLSPENFMRDLSEDANEVYAGNVQTDFQGPMTIRIHEADGTPYEHIVEVKQAKEKFEIPYNTKYKRLRRGRKQKDRGQSSFAPKDTDADGPDEVLLYCLGDVLQSEKDFSEWRLVSWAKDDEDKIAQQDYEWIRTDADFEWICKRSIVMNATQHISQLQQDRDVVAQLETLQWIATQRPSPLVSTFLARTVMDQRYFYGIRTFAASIMARCANSDIDWIGFFHLRKMYQELYCVPNSPTISRPNDFSDRSAYLVQCAMLQSMSSIKTYDGHAPLEVKRFFVDRMKFNDNSMNEYSDCYYISTLMRCLTQLLVPRKDAGLNTLNEEEQLEDNDFRKDAIGEIERYRRIDEWTSSFQNVFSVTALKCLLRLSKSNLLYPKIADFLQYTRSGNSDQVRLQAFDCIAELGKLKNEALSAYVLHSVSNDPSPYMREQLYRVFGKGLGMMAIGEERPEPKKQQVSDGLVIEQDDSAETRQADFARRQTIEGALAALKDEIQHGEKLKDSLWAAVTASGTSFSELARLVNLCETLYEPVDSVIPELSYPKYWRVEHVGNCKLRFFTTDKVRTSKMRPWIPGQGPSVGKAQGPALKLNLSRLQQSTSIDEGQANVSKTPATTTAPAQRPKPESSLIPPASANKGLVKLNVGHRLGQVVAALEKGVSSPVRNSTQSNSDLYMSPSGGNIGAVYGPPNTHLIAGGVHANGGGTSPLNSPAGALSTSSKPSSRKRSRAADESPLSENAIKRRRQSSFTPSSALSSAIASPPAEPQSSTNGKKGTGRKKSVSAKSKANAASPPAPKVNGTGAGNKGKVCKKAPEAAVNGTPKGPRVLKLQTNSRKRKSDAGFSPGGEMNGDGGHGAEEPPTKKAKPTLKLKLTKPAAPSASGDAPSSTAVASATPGTAASQNPMGNNNCVPHIKAEESEESEEE